MGVPAFFRWLSRKYNSIIVTCFEEKPKDGGDGVKIPVDTSQPNPNDVEFDNLYLDMNGIIHPCCHPEDKPAPKNEDEMMVDIFAYIDRIFSIVRPRRMLYMAIDGVAPRAKMNQQRSRRFRAAQESTEKREDMARIKEELRAKGASVPPDKKDSEHFDSNCITPGTNFMFKLAECLRFYVHDRLNNDRGWKGIKVILSDANVPGEGEHKIMDYIRRQRAQPDHDPNTHHCLCGADADLIMLGLATHEPNFTIIREEFKPNKPRPCDLCGQIGHEMKECTGLPKEKEGEHDELNKYIGTEQEFIFLRLSVAREYLERELTMTNLPFTQNMERAIDDWVLMCFFVGNDFLPHLPSLSIREGAIDRLVRLYKKAVYKTGGYLTENGFINLSRVQLVLRDLGEEEDEIFKKRRETDLRFRKQDKEKKKRQKMFDEARAPAWMSGQFGPQRLGGGGPSSLQNPRQAAYDARRQNMRGGGGGGGGRDQSNQNAAAQLRAMLNNGSEGEGQGRGEKRKMEVDEDEDDEPFDEVKLWEDGWKDRYYQSKFDVGSDDVEFRHKVANEYVLGLCWVLQYYYQGCPSWKWYFPYHYAPFASDFVNIGDLNTDFEKNTQPFKPLEQLMGVFPAASKQFLPPTWAELMCGPESPIIDFYPTNFKIDLNGKKFAWQGVALLPFVDEVRLKEVLAPVYGDLTEAEISRNIRGEDRLFIGKNNPAYEFLTGLYVEGGCSEKMEIDSKLTKGVRGKVWCDKMAVLEGQTVPSPLPQLQALTDNRAICVHYHDPEFPDDFVFKATVLPGAKFPEKTLKPSDFEQMNRGRGRGYRPQIGFTRDSGHRKPGSYDMNPALRHVRGALSGQQGILGNYGGRQSGGYGAQQGSRGQAAGYGAYSSIPPPLSWQGGSHQGGSNQYQQQRGYDNNSRRYGGGSSWQQQQQQPGRYGNQQAMDSYSTRQGGGGGGSGGYGGRGGGGYSGGSNYRQQNYQRDRRSFPPPPGRRY